MSGKFKNPARPSARRPARHLVNARRVALGVLDDVLEGKQTFDRAFKAARNIDQLDARDRAFVRLLLLTCFRRLGQIDALIGHFMKKEPKGKGRWVRSVLRLATAQLVFLDTPPHAAVSSALSLLEILKLDQFKGLANAVLRKIALEGKQLAADQTAGRLNTPDWLLRRWDKAYGPQTTDRICEIHLREPPLDITAKANPDVWAKKLGGTLLNTGSIRLENPGDIASLPGFKDGHWWVQDTAASLPVRLMGDVAGKSVIDLCAAPGGKSLQLAAAGARVISVDRSAQRMDRFRENLERTGLEAESIIADVLGYSPDMLADMVLLDAPCSATGTIRRHPDLLHQKNLQDVQRLASLQQEMLAAASRMVKPGGILIYATCSLQPEEGESCLRYFLKHQNQMTLDSFKAGELPGMEMLLSDGNLRCLPCHLDQLGGMDGFFAARLIRREN